jgi:autotransporter-associated beta strand protein
VPTTIYGVPTLDNALDLNGGSRTISVAQASGTNALSNSRAIIARNITGTGGGSLNKTGGGNLVLSGTNSYSGGTTISAGMIRFDTRTSMPASGNVSVSDGATLGVTVGGSATTWGAGTGNAGISGLTSGLGSQSGGTVSFAGNSSLLLNVTANTTESNSIGNGGATNLSLTKAGTNSLTLSGSSSYSGRTWVHTGTLSFNSIANVGGGNSALGAPTTLANGTISIGSDGNTATLAYTGSGHSSDRVINLPAASGTAVIDSSGTGPLTFSSSLTAVAGAKTLTLTGSNTAANTLGTTAIPGLAEVLTVNKTGIGTWRINGFSSQKNAWTVSAGTLIAAGNITTGDQNFTVSGGTLTGTGPITLQSTKTLTVQAAGSLAPGNSGVGTMAVTGILNISAMANGHRHRPDRNRPPRPERLCLHRSRRHDRQHLHPHFHYRRLHWHARPRQRHRQHRFD